LPSSLRAVLLDELARSVLTCGAVQLAVALVRETNTDARLTLALRLCEVLEAEMAVDAELRVTESV